MKINTKTLRKSFKKAQLTVRKHSPEILMVAGVIGTVAGAVMACKETLELEDVLDECKQEKMELEEQYAMCEQYSEDALKKDQVKLTIKQVAKIVKLYAPSVIMEATSIGVIFASNDIMRKRNASMAAAYATLNSMYKRYRQNVIESYGEEVDNDMRFGVKHEKVTEIDEDGNKVKIDARIVDLDNTALAISDYSRFFQMGCKGFDASSGRYNLLYLKGIQAMFNNKLIADGYVMLNDVYRELGFDTIPEGWSIGWVYDEANPIGDNYIDFGLYEARNKNQRAVNDWEPVILMDFNVDGNLYEDPKLYSLLKKKMNTGKTHLFTIK